MHALVFSELVPATDVMLKEVLETTVRAGVFSAELFHHLITANIAGQPTMLLKHI